MNFTSVPIIVVCCYIIGEIYKLIFKNHKNYFKFIPIFLACVGGLLGIAIYFTNPDIIFSVDNCWVAFYIGITSGVSSTGTNQLIKQIFKTE